MSQEETCKIIREGNGTQFDPLIIEAFENVKEKFYQIARQVQ